MDPIAHTFVGAALAESGLSRKSACASVALILGANLPDVDGLAMLAGTDTALLLRRGWTHGILAVLVLPLLLTGVLILWSRLRRTGGGPRVRAGWLLALSYLAVASHPSLDWLNNYGMRWLMPFDGRWYYGDSVFIVDPWMWLALGGAVFLRRSRHPASVLGWTVFAVLAVLLLVTVVPGLVWIKTLWLMLLGALVLLRVRGIGSEEPTSHRLATGALVGIGIYVAAMVASARYARQEVLEAISASGIPVERLMVGPVPVTPFVRDVVLQTPDGYRYGQARLFPRFELELASEELPLLGHSPVVRAATASPEVRGFMQWARFPFAEVEESRSGFIVYLLDARYTRERTEGFGAARVEISKRELEAAGE